VHYAYAHIMEAVRLEHAVDQLISSSVFDIFLFFIFFVPPGHIISVADPDPQGSASFGRIRIRIRNFLRRIRFFFQRSDPDPHQNYLDPQHCILYSIFRCRRCIRNPAPGRMGYAYIVIAVTVGSGLQDPQQLWGRSAL
jgi:hypothetical protein